MPVPISGNGGLVVTRQRFPELFHLEGRQVGLALDDGSRIDDCQLVFAGPQNVWVFVNGEDSFLDLTHVTDFWESS
jgi:hypothetical protein